MRKVSLNELKELALQAKGALWQQAQSLGRDVKLYLHWSAGHYGQFFDDYHINIDKDGTCYITTDNFADVLAHTWKRNTGSIGITLACGYQATSNDLGPEPPTDQQIEAMARVITVLADALDLTIDIFRVMTHGEAADNLDGYTGAYGHQDCYGPATTCERWDLAILKNGDAWCSGGDALRGKANWYRSTYPTGVENHF